MHRRHFLKLAPVGLAAAAGACRRPIESDLLAAPAPHPARFLFATGIENSYPRLKGGERNDQLDRTGHSERWRDDFELARSLGVDMLRFGPAWYRTNPAPGRYDWSSVDDRMEWLRRSGMEVVADLCHFGVPDWMSGFQDPALTAHLAAYARAFAERYPWVRFYTPLNEMFVAANFSANLGWWNECTTGKPAFAKAIRNMALAHELAVEAILEVRPDATIIQVESVERFEAADASPEAAAETRFWNEARFAFLDLTLGHTPSRLVRDLLADAGMTTADYAFLREPRAKGQRWIGVDYYNTSEQWVRGDGQKGPLEKRAGLASVAHGYYARYGLPLFVSETSRVTSEAEAWLAEQWEEVGRLVAAGVPVSGFTWFPLVDVVDWRHALREVRGDVDPIGLHSLDRTPHPVATAYRTLMEGARRRPVASADRGLRRIG